MTVTNLAINQQVALATILNTKLEAPILQSEMGLDTQATATRKAVRWDEFTIKHTDAGAFRAGIIATDDLANAAITQPKMKIKSVVALADAAATLTATQMIDSGIFTITPTVARALTTDTAVNLVAGMAGYQVGSWFEFTIVTLAAFAVTLTAGVGITLVGSSVTNNVSGTWLARIDSATAITMYRE